MACGSGWNTKVVSTEKNPNMYPRNCYSLADQEIILRSSRLDEGNENLDSVGWSRAIISAATNKSFLRLREQVLRNVGLDNMKGASIGIVVHSFNVQDYLHEPGT